MRLMALLATLIFSIVSVNTSFANGHQAVSDYTLSGDQTNISARRANASCSVSPTRPVDATHFRAAVISDAVMLCWRLENPERLKAGFLGRSTTGRDFTVICPVKKDMKGYTDVAPLPGSYYRIRLVANDGTVVYSSVVNTGVEEAPVAAKH